jgi:hypothetical protein
MTGLTLDAGALIKFDCEDRAAIALIRGTLARKVPIVIPAGVVAQVWRNGRTQVKLARLLRTRGVEIEPLDGRRAREAGQMCGLRGTKDVIDASVVLCAKRRQHSIATCDVGDLRRLDESVRLVKV